LIKTVLKILPILKHTAEQIIQIPNIANKRWVTVQYDSTVGAAKHQHQRTKRCCYCPWQRAPAKHWQFTTDCNSKYVFADPYKGGMIAVAEAARNIVCSGGEPNWRYQLSQFW
jgi:phosphoribosylformylglycinamidine synthase